VKIGSNWVDCVFGGWICVYWGVVGAGFGDWVAAIVGVWEAAGRFWGGCQFEADVELAEHVEGVDVVDFEVAAHVWYWDSSLDQGPVNFGNYLGSYPNRFKVGSGGVVAIIAEQENYLIRTPEPTLLRLFML